MSPLFGPIDKRIKWKVCWRIVMTTEIVGDNPIENMIRALVSIEVTESDYGLVIMFYSECAYGIAEAC
jgi:hypothetical protein